MREDSDMREALDHLTNLVEEAEEAMNEVADPKKMEWWESRVKWSTVLAARQFINRINHHEEEQ